MGQQLHVGNARVAPVWEGFPAICGSRLRHTCRPRSRECNLNLSNTKAEGGGGVRDAAFKRVNMVDESVAGPNGSVGRGFGFPLPRYDPGCC